MSGRPRRYSHCSSQWRSPSTRSEMSSSVSHWFFISFVEYIQTAIHCALFCFYVYSVKHVQFSPKNCQLIHILEAVFLGVAGGDTQIKTHGGSQPASSRGRIRKPRTATLVIVRDNLSGEVIEVDNQRWIIVSLLGCVWTPNLPRNLPGWSLAKGPVQPPTVFSLETVTDLLFIHNLARPFQMISISQNKLDLFPTNPVDWWSIAWRTVNLGYICIKLSLLEVRSTNVSLGRLTDKRTIPDLHTEVWPTCNNTTYRQRIF